MGKQQQIHSQSYESPRFAKQNIHKLIPVSFHDGFNALPTTLAIRKPIDLLAIPYELLDPSDGHPMKHETIFARLSRVV